MATSEQREKMEEHDWEEKMSRLSVENGWIFIAISGITNSGKSTVAKRITETMPAHTVNQDVFFRVCELAWSKVLLLNKQCKLIGP